MAAEEWCTPLTPWVISYCSGWISWFCEHLRSCPVVEYFKMKSGSSFECGNHPPTSTLYPTVTIQMMMFQALPYPSISMYSLTEEQKIGEGWEWGHNNGFSCNSEQFYFYKIPIKHSVCGTILHILHHSVVVSIVLLTVCVLFSCCYSLQNVVCLCGPLSFFWGMCRYTHQCDVHCQWLCGEKWQQGL